MPRREKAGGGAAKTPALNARVLELAEQLLESVDGSVELARTAIVIAATPATWSGIRPAVKRARS